MSEQSLLEVDLARLCDRQFFPSPAAWEDQVLYFLMLDRFSDGNEQGYRGNNGRRVRRGTTPLFQPTDAENAIQTPGGSRALARGRGTLGGWYAQRFNQQDRLSPTSGGDRHMGQSDL